MAHMFSREAWNPVHIQIYRIQISQKLDMHEIEMSQRIVVRFEKLERQNVHQYLLYIPPRQLPPSTHK